jgi:L-lactate dehydrogenase (cytochrome)
VSRPRPSLRNSAFLNMAAKQLAGDIRAAPTTLTERFSDIGRARRCANIAELRAAARRALPKPAFDFIDGAASDEVTLRRNCEEFSALALRPRFMRDVSNISLSTTVLGEPIALPIMGAPTGGSLVFNSAGEVGIARALHDAGSIYIVSSMATQSIEQLAEEAPGPKWIQMYMWRDRGLTSELIQRARATGGFSALVFTVDTPRVGPRERDVRSGFTVPPRITARALASGFVHPRWSLRFIRAPEIGLANLVARPGGESINLRQYVLASFDQAVSWDDVGWLRGQWPGPIVLKGILTGEDGAKAAELAVDAIVVSNHGGRQLDHSPATIRALPEVLDAVGGEVEVLIDGGIRRGTDIAKAIALGARACLVGRPVIYGLATAGQAGASRAIEILRDELELTMALLGCTSIQALDRSYVAPAGWPSSQPSAVASQL